jgi:hypothetical protein
MKIKSLALLVLLQSVSIHAANLYVSTFGNDTNSGTSHEHACRTIQKGADNACKGDTVFVDTGVYNEKVWITHSGVTFIGLKVGNNRPIIDGDSITDMMVPQLNRPVLVLICGNHTIFKGFMVRHAGKHTRDTVGGNERSGTLVTD